MWDTVAFSTIVTTACSLAVLWWVLVPDKRVRALSRMYRPVSTLPIIGNTLDVMFKHRDDFHDWLRDECERSGGKPWLMTLVGRPPSIVLTSVAAFEDVMSKQFERFAKLSNDLASDVFGDGIFAVDGLKWVHQRKTSSHLFSHQMMREVMERVVLDKAALLCKLLENKHAENKAENLKDIMDWYATDVFVEIGFGVDLGCLKQQQKCEFFRSFTRLPMAIHARVQQPHWLWKLKRALNIAEERQLKQDLEVVNGAIFQMIADSMNSRARTPAGEVGQTASQRNLVSLFLEKDRAEYTNEDGEAVHVPTTPKLIRDMAFNFTAAGRGTSAQSLQWFIIMLNRYPDVEQKIRAELQSKLPHICGSGATQVAPTMLEIQQLTYLEAAIKESLRLNPAAPLIGRTAVQDTELSDGTFLRAGTRVVIPAYASARLENIWGDDAAEYKPERWIDSTTGKLLPVSPFKFLVFYGGPRMCLGAKLAMLELKVALASILSKFHLHTTRDPFEIQYAPSLSLPIRGSVFVTVEPVDLPHSASVAA